MIPVFGAPELRRASLAALEALRARQDEIDAANIYPVPDGDTGTNLVLTMSAVAEALTTVPDDPRDVASAIQRGSLTGARGNSGVILAQILRGVCEQIDDDGLDARSLTKGLDRGTALAYEAVLVPVEGTILTVARRAAEAASDVGADDCIAVLDAASRAANDALEETPELLPVLKQAGVVDAGGLGLCVVLDAFAASAAGRPLAVATRALRPVVRQREAGSGAFAYEVQYLIEGTDDDQAAALRQRLGGIGDSVAVVGGAGLWNVHVHTNDVGRAIELGMAIGRPHDISVVAFADQIASVAGSRSIPVAAAPSQVSVVAVVAGDGVRDLFAELGAGVLIDGGRTMNPSVGELADAIERAPAEEVLLLIGNRDTIPAARASIEQSSSKRVRLIPTADLAQSFAAMVAFSDGRSAGDNERDMLEALRHTRTGRVAIAIREANLSIGRVSPGDAIGFADGEPVAAGRDPASVLSDVADALGDGEVLTIVTGADAPEGEVAAAVGALRERRGTTVVEVREGGQPIDRYLLALE